MTAPKQPRDRIAPECCCPVRSIRGGSVVFFSMNCPVHCGSDINRLRVTPIDAATNPAAAAEPHGADSPSVAGHAAAAGAPRSTETV